MGARSTSSGHSRAEEKGALEKRPTHRARFLYDGPLCQAYFPHQILTLIKDLSPHHRPDELPPRTFGGDDKPGSTITGAPKPFAPERSIRALKTRYSEDPVQGADRASLPRRASTKMRRCSARIYAPPPEFGPKGRGLQEDGRRAPPSHPATCDAPAGQENSPPANLS